MESAKKEEEIEDFISDNIWSKEFGSSSTVAQSEKITIDVESVEDKNVVIVCEDMDVVSKNLEKEEDENLIAAINNVFYNEEAGTVSIVSRSKEEDEKKNDLKATDERKNEEDDKSNGNGFTRIGHRYVNLGHVTKEILRLTSQENRHKATCANGQWELLDFTDKGEMTYVYFQSKECLEIIKFLTHPNDEDTLNPNYAYVLRCLTAGIGCSNAEEMRAAQGVPTMSAKTFRKY